MAPRKGATTGTHHHCLPVLKNKKKMYKVRTAAYALGYLCSDLEQCKILLSPNITIDLQKATVPTCPQQFPRQILPPTTSSGDKQFRTATSRTSKTVSLPRKEGSCCSTFTYLPLLARKHPLTQRSLYCLWLSWILLLLENCPSFSATEKMMIGLCSRCT